MVYKLLDGPVSLPLLRLLLCGVLQLSPGTGSRSFPSLSDDIPFRITWPGAEFSLPTTGGLYKPDDYVIVTTVDNERYKCMLPSVGNGDEGEDQEYKGLGPAELLEPLFKQSSCSYRIESYWTYEVCHGKHIRQYHEEKETGQKVNIQEYYLGATNTESETKEAEQEEKKRMRKNILSVAEVTTCEYELVILTPLLCNHPKYRFRSSPVNDIFCQSMHGSPLRPQSLERLEKQEEEMKPPLTAPRTNEGVGWWKYEFCYGKHVQQYHEDKGAGKSIIVVGTWNKEDHNMWSKKNSPRSYQWMEDGEQKVRVVSHFYGNGDLCDLTGKPRQVVVKLKCKESESPHAVTIYMLEPQTCQYILGVESPVICKILDTADEYGALSVPS
uniref:Endoplasmic reticulum lectin n=1 Tax=Callorhinchus milii TaxID=7868 RepID=A0A4W3GXU4_CALMI